jgi:3-hydroxybutyryl-CoA dehydrogenase
MSGRIAVIGAGTMGAGIGYVAAASGYDVTIVELDPARGEAARVRIGDWSARAVSRGKSTPEEAAGTVRRLSVVTEISQLETGAEVIIEAVPERLELKRDVLAAAQQREPKLLASNTSSIAIGTLADGLNDPGRFVGLHFFNPVYAMSLLEIVVGPATEQATTRAAVELAVALGKDPIVVNDAPGFATSRLGNALGLEAIRMLESGVAAAADIDKAMVLGYRHPMGPLELTDVIGLDVRLDIARTLEKAYGDRFSPPKLLRDMVADGKLGKKSGEGFYRWDETGKVQL